MSLVQIGSGSANFQDGFTNFIKQKNKKGKILIVEANSIHLKNLRKFWKFKKNIKIFNLAIIPDNISQKKMTFYYSEKDKPNYQVFSNSKSFVKKHFPQGKIKKTIVNCLNISNFLKKNKMKKIDYLALDIEGMDCEVLLNLDFNNFYIKNISFEHLHLSVWQKFKIIFKFIKNDYYFSGMGFDIKKSDWMFTKGYKFKKIITFFLPITPRRIWKKYLFSKYI
jgi:FkbM family methyltransferase